MDDLEMLAIIAAGVAVFSLSGSVNTVVHTVTDPINTFFGNNGNSATNPPSGTLLNGGFALDNITGVPWNAGSTILSDIKGWGDPDKWFS